MTNLAKTEVRREVKVWAAWHPTFGYWLPCIRATEGGAIASLANKQQHLGNGWEIIPVTIVANAPTPSTGKAADS